jgi:hypothetical protein
MSEGRTAIARRSFRLNHAARVIFNRRSVTVANSSVLQCDAAGEFTIAESIREILRQEQDQLIDLAEALEVDPPAAGIA